MRKIQTFHKGCAETLSFDYQPSVMSQVGMDAFPSQVLAPCSETAALFLPPTKLPTQFWNRGLNEMFSGDPRRQNADKISHPKISDLHKFLTCLWTVDENNGPVTPRGRCSSEIDVKNRRMTAG